MIREIVVPITACFVVTLLAFTYLFSISKPMYEKGQCLQSIFEEDLQAKPLAYTYKVKYVGRSHYLLQKLCANDLFGKTDCIEEVQKHYDMVEFQMDDIPCPPELKNI